MSLLYDIMVVSGSYTLKRKDGFNYGNQFCIDVRILNIHNFHHD